MSLSTAGTAQEELPLYRPETKPRDRLPSCHLSLQFASQVPPLVSEAPGNGILLLITMAPEQLAPLTFKKQVLNDNWVN